MKTDEERLASRYWDLLDFYPKSYRDERGPELVGALLEGAQPGQTRPSWREARALVLEGLRVRAGTGGHRSRRATLAGGVQPGLLILLVGSLLSNVTAVASERGHEDLRPVTPGWWVLFVLAVLAMVVPFALLALGRVRVVLPFVVIAGAVEMAGFQWLHRTGWADQPFPPSGWTGILPIYLDPGTATVLIAGTLLLIRLRPPPVGPPVAIAAVVPPVLVWIPDWLRGAGPVPVDIDVALWPVMSMMLLLGYVGIESLTVSLKWGFDSGIILRSVAYVVVIGVPVGIAAWLGARRQDRLTTPDLLT